LVNDNPHENEMKKQLVPLGFDDIVGLSPVDDIPEQAKREPLALIDNIESPDETTSQNETNNIEIFALAPFSMGRL